MENTVSIVARTPVQSTSNVSNDDILPSSRILKEVYLSENLQSNTLVDSTIKPNHTQLADAAAGVLQSGLDRDKGSQSDVVDSTPQVARVDNIATMCEDGDVVVVDATPVRALLERDIKGEAEYARKAIQTKTTAINTKTDKAEAPETGSSNSEKKGEKLKESEHVQSTSVYKSGIKVASDSKDVDTSTPQPGEDICTEGIGASVRVPATTTNPNAKPEVRTSTRVSRSAAQASVPTASLNKMHTRASAGDNAGVRPKRGTVGSRKGADTKSGVTKVPAEAAKNKKGKAAAKVKTQPSVAKAKKITPFSTAKKVVAQKPKDLSPFLVSSSKEHDPKATPFSAGLKRPHSDHTTTPSKTVLDLTGESTQVVDVMGEQPSDSKRLKPTTVEIGTTAPTDGAGASVPENKEKSPQKTTSAQEKEKVAHTPSNADKTSTTSQTTATKCAETTDSAKTRTGTKAISTSDDTDPIASTPEETHSQTQNIDIHADKTDIADTQERESRKRKASEREGVVAVQSESVSTSATPANAGKLKPTAERSVTRESTEGSSLEQTPAGIPSENQEKPSTATVSKKRRASAISAGSAKNSVSKKEALENERERKRLAKEQERLEKMKQREEEKQAKEEERAAKRRKIEQERERKEAIKTAEREKAEKIKQEQKEAREKIRLAKEAEKQAVIDKRDRERAEKDAEKAKIDAEKEAIRLAKQKEEDKAIAKKRKQAAMFSNFFVKPSGGAGSCSTGSSAKSETATRVIDPSTDANSNTLEPSANNSILTGKMTEIKAFEEYFIPFEVPLHARMAKSSVRRPLSEVEFVALNRTWDSARQSTQPDKDTETVKVIIPNQGTDSEDNAVASKAMLDELISCGQSGKWRVEADSKRNKKKNRGEENDEDVVCLGSAPESSGVSKEAYTGLGGSQTMHLKLLQFHDNYRPPYFGTWSRKSAQISGRTPFKMDTDLFDYDVVSDEEWEEEPEGEDLSDDEKEADADAEDVEEEEDGFVVPHGYLSDDEGVVDGEGDEKDDSSKSGIRNEARDKKLEIAGARAAMSHLRLRPVVIGCIYDDDEGCLNAKDQKQLTCLQTYAIVPTNPQELPICVDEPIPEPSPPPPPKAQTELTPEQTNELVALVHANNYKLKMFSDEFRAKYPELRVKLVKDAIKSFAEWGRRNGEPFRRWWLTPEILEKYGLPSQEPAKPTPAATATVTATANTTANTTATTESAIAPSKAKQNATKLTKVLPKIIRQAPVKTTDRPNIADMLTTKGLPAVAVSPVSKEVADTKAQTTKAQPSISDFFRTKPTHMEAPDEEAIQPQQREPCVGSAQPTIHILVAKKKRVTPTLEQALSSRSPPTQLANMNSPQTLTSIEPQPVISCQNTANNSGNKEEIAKTIAKADIDTQTNGSSNAHLRSPKVTIRKAHSSPNK